LVNVSLPKRDSIVFDTSVVIAYLNGDEAISGVARVLFEDFVATERNAGWISSVTVGEALIRPLQAGGTASEVVRSFLLDFPGLSVRSADFLVAAQAAGIRAHTRASLTDAMIAATATVTSSPWLVTNDRRLRDHLAGLNWETTILLLSEMSA
jgi:predicted nucleic acid-binding protein